MVLGERMKVGCCGLGDRMAYLSKVFQKANPEFEIVAFADPAPTGLHRMGEGADQRLRGYSELEHMLKVESLDLLMIGSPNAYHYEQLSVALDAGVKIFCEKPVVVSKNETLGLLEKLNHYGTDAVMVGLVLRYAPLYKDLIRIVDSGALGIIISIEASEHIPPVHGAFFFRDWRRKSSYSGGFLLEKCCHDIDLYAGVVKSRPRRVASFGGCSFFNERHSHLDRDRVYKRWPAIWNSAESSFSGDADIVDHQIAMIEYENGSQLCFHTNVHAPDAFRRFCVIGSEGMVEGDFVRGYLKFHDAKSGKCRFERNYKADASALHYGADEKMAEDIVAHLESGNPLPVSVVDALEAGLTALKIDEARHCGQVLEMQEDWRQFDSLLEH